MFWETGIETFEEFLELWESINPQDPIEKSEAWEAFFSLRYYQ